MILKPGGTFTFQAFVTTSAGALVNADAAPTATVNRNGTDDGSVAVTITNPSTGRYVVTATVPSGYVAGDVVNVALFYVVSAAATARQLGTFTVDTARISDAKAVLDAVKTELDAAKTELDAVKLQTDKLLFDGSSFVKSAAQNLPSDYQKSGFAVTLPSLPNVTVGAYATGQDPATYILATPSRKLATDVSGNIGVNNFPALPTNFSSLVITSTGLVKLDLTQAVPMANTVQTVGDALNAARAQGFGNWVLVNTGLTLYAGDNTTIAHSFTLDSATTPTRRS